MNGTWANLAFFWTLGALIIPLAIHLWNRKQGKIIWVGSTQLLPPKESAKANRFKLHEVALWSIRSLLVACLTALLMGWLMPPKPTTGPSRIHLVDPMIGNWLNSMTWDQPNATHWLGPEFPAITSPCPDTNTDSGWKWLAQAAEFFDFPDSVAVYTDLSTDQWPYPAPAFPFEVEWILVPSPEPKQQTVQAWEGNSQSVSWVAKAEDFTVKVSKQYGRTTPESIATPQWRVYVDGSQRDQAYLTTALATAATYAGVSFSIADRVEDANIGFYLRSAPSSLPPSQLGITFLPQKHPHSWWSAQPDSLCHIAWHILPSAATVTKEQWHQLPAALIECLLPSPVVEYPQLPEQVIVSKKATGAQPDVIAHGWLLIALVILLLGERIIATWRKA